MNNSKKIDLSVRKGSCTKSDKVREKVCLLQLNAQFQTYVPRRWPKPSITETLRTRTTRDDSLLLRTRTTWMILCSDPDSDMSQLQIQTCHSSRFKYVTAPAAAAAAAVVLMV